MVPFPNGRCEGVNPSSRVIVLPNLESQTCFVNQLYCFKLGILVPSLKTCIPGNRSHPYRKDRWRLHFNFVVIQVERETVMTKITNTFNLYFKETSNLKEGEENRTMAFNHILTYKMTLKRHEATHHPRVTKLNTQNILINGLVKNKVITWTQPWGERRAQKNNADNSSLPPLKKILLFLLNLQTGGI